MTPRLTLIGRVQSRILFRRLAKELVGEKNQLTRPPIYVEFKDPVALQIKRETGFEGRIKNSSSWIVVDKQKLFSGLYDFYFITPSGFSISIYLSAISLSLRFLPSGRRA